MTDADHEQRSGPGAGSSADAHQRQAAEELERNKALALRIALGLSVALGLAIFVFWFGWVRAPAPEAICKHKVELVLETVGEGQREGAEALIGQLEVKCVDAARRKIKLRGKIVYAEYAKCVMAATTLTEAERC